MIFKYKSTRVMPSRNGYKFSTTYWKQTDDQRKSSKARVIEICNEIYQLVSTSEEYAEYMITPLKNFKRLDGENYTPEDIITDMLKQYIHQKDLCSGMLGRWNRLFKNTDYEIFLEEDITVHFHKETNFHNIFKLM